MTKKNTKSTLTPALKKLIDPCIPWCIFNQKWYYNIREYLSQESIKIYFTRARKKELIKDKTFPVGPTQAEHISRDVLTQKGIQEYLNSIDTTDPLYNVDRDNFELRKGKNAGQLKSLIIASDIQYFLNSVGVDSIYTAITRKNENPFVFGYPDNLKEDAVQRSFSDIAMCAIVDFLDAEDKLNKGKKYCYENNSTMLFLPNRCNAKRTKPSKTPNQKKTLSFDNSAGLLLDFRHQRCYLLFKGLIKRKEITWQGQHYGSLRYNYRTEMHQWRMKNVNHYGGLEDAFIFCETKKEVKAKATFYRKMNQPFTHVIPILMKKEGAETLERILLHGIDGYLALLDRAAVTAIPGLSYSNHPSPSFRLTYNGTSVYTGTLLDFKRMNVLAKQIDNKMPVYVVCYEWQVPIYRDIVGVPSEYLLVMPD